MLGKNLRKLRKEHNLTLEKLANNLNNKYQDKEKTINFNKGKLSKWENDKEQPYLSSARLVADYFDVTVDWLMGRDISDNKDITPIYNQLEKTRQVKVYNFAEHQLEEQNNNVVNFSDYTEEKQTVELHSVLSAGTGIIDLDPTDTEIIEYNGYVPSHDLAFRVSGDSMIPLFKDGEIVFVKKTQDVHNGQVIAVQINEEAYIKKVYIENDRLRLVSLNKDYEDIYADDDIRVVGRVIL